MLKIIEKVKPLIINQQMRVLPGQLAFFLVLSLVPLLTLTTYILVNFQFMIDIFNLVIKDSIPEDMIRILSSLVSQPASVNTISFMIFGFIVASNGSNSVILASNWLFDLPAGSFIKRRVKAVIMLFMLITMFIIIGFGLAFGTTLLNFVLSLEWFKTEVYLLIEIFKWPLSMALIYFFVKTLYTIAPDSPIPSKYMNKGALFVTVGFTIVTYVYSFYVNNFANYSLFYGNLSNIVILMFWIYLLSYLFVLGIAINAYYYKKDK